MEAQDYKDQVNLLAKTKIEYTIVNNGGYRDILEPMLVVLHSVAANAGANLPRVVKAKKALKWYSDTWNTVDTHLDSINGITNLAPQTFIDSLTLPTL